MRIGLTLVMIAAVVASCGWRGLNSLPLPGTQGNGPGSFAVQAQLPDVNNIQPNSRVRVADVTVGHVTKIERQGWHALVTMRLDGDVDLPANATAKIGTTSLLGSYHIELAPPKGEARQGKLRDGSLIALSHGSAYPSTEQTLAALSLVLNSPGVRKIPAPIIELIPSMTTLQKPSLWIAYPLVRGPTTAPRLSSRESSNAP